MRVTRRRFTRDLAAAGAGALVLPGLLRGPAHGQAKPGGQLTVALYKDLRTLNPIMGIFGNEWRDVLRSRGLDDDRGFGYDLALRGHRQRDAQTLFQAL